MAGVSAPSTSVFTRLKSSGGLLGGPEMDSADITKGSECWGESPARFSCSPLKSLQIPVNQEIVAGCSTTKKDDIDSKG